VLVVSGGIGRRSTARITTPDYDKYVTRYKAEKEELEYRLVEYTNNDKSFILTASHLLELAQNARSIFQSSQPAQKNKILKALLANCQINEKRLQLNLLKPFSVLIDSTLSQNWLALANELRTASMDYADSEVSSIKGLLLGVS